MNKPIIVFDSSIFCDFYQTTGLPSFTLFASFFKPCKTFPYVCFIIFILLHIGFILLYPFVNLLKRFGKHVLHFNFLMDGIRSIKQALQVISHFILRTQVQTLIQLTNGSSSTKIVSILFIDTILPDFSNRLLSIIS